MTKGNDLAYPVALGGKDMNGQDDYIADGLTKREYFAAMAMQGMVILNSENSFQDDAIKALLYADALIEQLNKQP